MVKQNTNTAYKNVMSNMTNYANTQYCVTVIQYVSIVTGKSYLDFFKLVVTNLSLNFPVGLI